jgi:hypothetical protein
MSTAPAWAQKHFPPPIGEAAPSSWSPIIRKRALAVRVLAVANTRIEGAWCAYVDAVPGINHDHEIEDVRRRGAKLSEDLARVLFSEFQDIPYAY